MEAKTLCFILGDTKSSRTTNVGRCKNAAQNMMNSEHEQDLSFCETPYTSRQAMGKALKHAHCSLPSSPQNNLCFKVI